MTASARYAARRERRAARLAAEADCRAHLEARWALIDHQAPHVLDWERIVDLYNLVKEP